MAERYGSELSGALPEATVLGFDDYYAIGDRLDDVLAGRPLARTPRATAHPAADQPRRPHARRGGAVLTGHPRPRLAQAHPLTTGPSPRSSSPRAATGGARSAPSRPSAAPSSPGRWPRSSARRSGWPARASPRSCWSARTPRPTARTSATCAPWRSCCPAGRHRGPGPQHPGGLPAAGRAAPRVAGDDREHPRVAPYFDLSFQHSSPTLLRRMRRFGGTDDFLALVERAGPSHRRRVPHQRHPRVPRGDRGRRRRARAVPHRGPAWTPSACSATPTRTAPRPPAWTVTCPSTRSTPASPASPTWSRSSPPSAPRSASAPPCRCCSPRTWARHLGRPRRAPGPRRRRHHHGVRCPRRRRPRQVVPAEVTGTEGIDLVAACRVPVGAGADRA